MPVVIVAMMRTTVRFSNMLYRLRERLDRLRWFLRRSPLAEKESRVVRDLRVLLEERGEDGIRGEVVGPIEQRRVDPQHFAHRRRILVQHVAEPLARLPRIGLLGKQETWRRLSRRRRRLRALGRDRGCRPGRLRRLLACLGYRGGHQEPHHKRENL